MGKKGDELEVRTRAQGSLYRKVASLSRLRRVDFHLLSKRVSREHYNERFDVTILYESSVDLFIYFARSEEIKKNHVEYCIFLFNDFYRVNSVLFGDYIIRCKKFFSFVVCLVILK